MCSGVGGSEGAVGSGSKVKVRYSPPTGQSHLFHTSAGTATCSQAVPRLCFSIDLLRDPTLSTALGSQH